MRSPRFVVALCLVACFTAIAAAQPPQPIVPKPQAPTLNPVTPFGMPRGTTLELTLTGINLAEPTGLWTSFPAKIVIPTDMNNGKEATKLRVVLDVPSDAPLGCHSLRLATSQGMSNFRLFCIDDLPQTMEVDANQNKATPQALTTPSVVIGRADAEKSDWYKVTVKAGERLSFEVLGRRLGSGFDPQLTLYDAATGRELPGGHSNDSPGAQTDPRLSYTFKEAGDVLVEVRDMMWRGGADFFYRLRVGDFPLATSSLPLAAKRGSKVSVTFAGPHVEGVAPVETVVPTDPLIDTVWVTPRFANGVAGWPVALAVGDLEEAQEQEPNNEPAKANRVAVPGGISCRFLDKGDVDHLVFAGVKGQRIVIEAESLELGSPTEVYMTLRDAKGAQLAVTNPAQAPRIDFTPQADGDLTLAVEHLHYWGGPTETYRVTIKPYQPGFTVTLPLDRYSAAPEGTTSIPVVLNARRDYTGPIELSVLGPPGITGKATINANQAPTPANQQQIAAQIPVQVAADVPMGPYSLTVVAQATINGKLVTEYVSPQPAIATTLANLPFPPRPLLKQVGFAVTEKPPFRLTARFEPAEAIKGAPINVTVTAERGEGVTEDIALTAQGLPANVTAAVKPIPKGMNEVKFAVTPAAAAALGAFPISFVGKTKVNGKEYSFTSPPASLVVALPFDLKVEPVPVKLTAGDKATIKVTATRKGGYNGPIALQTTALPANVTAAAVTIPMDQTTAEIELTAAENAALGDKADVGVTGTAPAAANQQNSSPKFTISVVKK